MNFEHGPLTRSAYFFLIFKTLIWVVPILEYFDSRVVFFFFCLKVSDWKGKKIIVAKEKPNTTSKNNKLVIKRIKIVVAILIKRVGCGLHRSSIMGRLVHTHDGGPKKLVLSSNLFDSDWETFVNFFFEEILFQFEKKKKMGEGGNWI